MSTEPVRYACVWCGAEAIGAQLGLWFQLPAGWLALLRAGDVLWTCSAACASSVNTHPIAGEPCADCGGCFSHADTCAHPVSQQMQEIGARMMRDVVRITSDHIERNRTIVLEALQQIANEVRDDDNRE